MTYNKDTYTLSTGRSFYANRGFIGITGSLELSEGYDGDIRNVDEFTQSEKDELADFMIELWQRFKKEV